MALQREQQGRRRGKGSNRWSKNQLVRFRRRKKLEAGAFRNRKLYLYYD